MLNAASQARHMMNRSSTIRFLFIFVLTISWSCKNPGGQEKLAHHPEEIKTVENNQPEPRSPAGENKNYVPGEIVVKFHDGTKKQAIQGIIRDLHLETIRIVSEPDLYLLKILDGCSVESVVERLDKYEEVKYSEPNYIRTTN